MFKKINPTNLKVIPTKGRDALKDEINNAKLHLKQKKTNKNKNTLVSYITDLKVDNIVTLKNSQQKKPLKIYKSEVINMKFKDFNRDVQLISFNPNDEPFELAIHYELYNEDIETKDINLDNKNNNNTDDDIPF